ncbi:MAG: hypothetical protein J5554_09115 [Paludibacteraceae bacterium]|nr:hypothetical protein [Paludibacteraceae bacterium]
MIYKGFLVFAFATLLMSCGGAGNQSQNGEGQETPSCCQLKATKVYTPTEVMDNGEELLETEIQVQGAVKKVCCRSGKKCFLVDDSLSSKPLTVMAAADMDTFPKSLKGQTIVVKGIVKENRITKQSIEEKLQAVASANQGATPEAEGKSCCKKEASEEAHGHNGSHGHCGQGNGDLDQMKAWMESHDKDYFPIYFVEAVGYAEVE